MSVADGFWNAIESVLGGNSARLPAGTTTHSLASAEEHIGSSFPDSLHKLLIRHDGSSAYFLDCAERCHYLMSIAWIVDTSNRKRDTLDTSIRHKTVGPVSSVSWNSGWIPIATNTDGNYLLIDYSPPESGAIGQLIYMDHEGTNSWVSESIDSWLESMTHKIANSECAVVHDENA